MTNVGYVHNFKRCKGGIACIGLKNSRLNCVREHHWYSNDPRLVHENLFGQKSIWIRKYADRYK